MRSSLVALICAPLLLVAWLWACTRAPAPAAAPANPVHLDAPPPVAGRAGAFSAERAWADLTALVAVGPRGMGTPGSERARGYIAEQLQSLGIEPELQPAGVMMASDVGSKAELVNLCATIPGGSEDLIVLAAPYDSASRDGIEGVGANQGASGAALLLELARVIAAEPLAYTVQVCFFDGEALLASETAGDAGIGLLGSRASVEELRQRNQLARIRLLIYFDRVSDADLRIARDRASHRIHRNAIWRAAAALGYTDAFPPDIGFEAPVAGHRSFIDHGMRRAVAIIDPHFGAGELGDTLENSSRDSLRTVGRVTLYALEGITRRLAKIDRFSEAPTFDESAAEAASGPEPDAATSPAPTELEAAEPLPVEPNAAAEPDPSDGPLPVEEPVAP